MSLEKNVQRMLLENPDPAKIGRGLIFVLLKTLLTPASFFRTKSEKRLNLVLYDYARRFFRNPERAVFTSLFAPIELVHAFNLLPFSLEIFAAVAAIMNLAPELLARAEKQWLSTDFCSFHRVYMQLATGGLLPKPAFLLATSHTCDGTFKSFFQVSDHLSSPFVFLNTPYHRDREGVRYLARQIKEAVKRIEDITGSALKSEDLEKVFHFSNEARLVFQDINDLKGSGSPLMYGEEALVFILVFGNLVGTRAGLSLFEAYRKELLSRQERGFDRIKGKKRILWLHLKPFFPSALMTYLERELGAVVVAEEINSVYWDDLNIRDPWVSLAEKLLSNYWVGGIEKRLGYIRRTIEEYHIDGVIHFSHWGCRQSNGGVRLIKDTVQEYGIPFLNLDGDCIDARNFSEAQYITRLEGFMEILG